MIKYDLVLFDLDGTISETGKGVEHCIKCTLDELGIPYPPQEMFRTFIGPPLKSSLLKCGILPENIDNAIQIYREYYTECLENFCEPYDGVKETIVYLHNKGVRMAVATSKRQDLAIKLLKHIDLYKYFDFIAGSGENNINQTKTDVIRYAIEKMGIIQNTKNKNIVLIGDTKFDAEGAINTGCDFIGVLYGYGSMQEMQYCGFDTFVENMRDLKDILLN